MEKKLKKNWFGRLKNKDEIHYDSKEWISEINFINDEMRFLEQLLKSHYTDLVNREGAARIKTLEDDIREERTKGETLYKIIIDHDNILAELIENESVNSNLHFLETHFKLEREMFGFLRTYKELKAEIYGILEDVIKKQV